MTVAYYAHPMSWYGSDDEAVDLAALRERYDIVLNPGGPTMEGRYQKWLHQFREVGIQPNPMQFFADVVKEECDVVVFRSFKDGKIGTGVAREVFEGMIWDKRIDRLYTHNNKVEVEVGYPLTLVFNRVLTAADTKARIMKGKR